MDWTLIFGTVLLAWGGLLVQETVQHWRRPLEENFTLFDKWFMKRTGADKLPPTWIDRWLNRYRLARKAVTGLLMLVIGGYLILANIGAT